MLASTLVVLALTAPLGDSGTPGDRALTFYNDGNRHYAAERFERALKSFEMAAMLAEFAFTEGDLLPDSLRMASSSALLAGNPEKARERSRAYLKWAEKHPPSNQLLRARNDVLEACLLAGDRDAARAAADAAAEAANAAHGREEVERLRGLRERMSGKREVAGVGGRARRPEPDAEFAEAIRSRTVRAAEGGDASTATADEPAQAPSPEAIPAMPTEPVPGRVIHRAVPAPEPTEPASSPPPATPTREPITTPAPISVPTVSMTPTTSDADAMVLIPAGRFRMGDDFGHADEKPTRDIELSAFYLDRTEVTNAAFARFAAESGYRASGDWEQFNLPGHEQFPVRGLTQEDAAIFARAHGKRLPTEAEWERAARGPEGHPYAFGATFSTDKGRVGRSTSEGPVAIRSLEPNSWGLYDLTGNVMEWCADWYDPKTYRGTHAESPLGPAQGNRRVARGGAWDSGEHEARNAARIGVPAARASARIGFRCARDAP